MRLYKKQNPRNSSEVCMIFCGDINNIYLLLIPLKLKYNRHIL